MMRKLLLAACALAGLASAAPAEDPLRVIFVDVEGGAAALYVTPQGHSLLIDTGWPAGIGGPRPAPGTTAPPSPSSAERIVTAAKAAGLGKIDYLLVTHYHIDHVGGVAELVKLFPIGTVIDHGPNREELAPGASPQAAAFAPATLYPKYLAAIAGHTHRAMKAGETLRIDDLLLTAIDSDREVIKRPVPGAGAPGVGCDKLPPDPPLGGEENPRSLGILFSFGKARLLSLGDTTMDVENKLVCPRNLIGRVDVMVADNHGSSNSNSPALLNSIAPRLFVMQNGFAKGADPETYPTVMRSPRIEAIWQIHTSRKAADLNPPVGQIANPGEGADAMRPLELAVRKDGTVKVTAPSL
jgi:beta-lactamase superfamily II metal-dependent hydrolase